MFVQILRRYKLHEYIKSSNVLLKNVGYYFLSRISLQTYVKNYIENDAATPSTQSHLNHYIFTNINTITTDNYGITLTCANNGFVYYPHIFNANDDWEFSVEIGAKTSGSQHPYIAPVVLNANTLTQCDYVTLWSSSLLSYYPSKWPEDSSEQKYYASFNVGDKITLRRENGTTYVYLNDILRLSHTHAYDGNILLGYSLNNLAPNQQMTFKNIKIKRL